MTELTGADHVPWWLRGPVLEGHRMKKRKLVSPLSDLPQHQFVSTLDQIFPELFWLALLFEETGPHLATRTAIPLVDALYKSDDTKHWYRTSTLFTNLEEACNIANGCSDVARPKAVEDVFGTLSDVYATKNPKQCEIDKVSRAVELYYDKSMPSYCSILATCVVALGVSGRMQFPPSSISDVNAIVEEAGSDRAEAASSSMRALSMMIFPMDEDDNSRLWCRHFWDTNFVVSRCDFD